MGTLLAFTALCTWGIGDFLIQRSSRRFGSVITLFSITGLAAVVLLPWAWPEIIGTVTDPAKLKILLLTSGAILVAALLNFESLRRGKISVIEPIYAGEIPVAAGLAAFFLGETLSPVEVGLITLLVVSIAVLSTESFKDLRSIKFEPGLGFAIGGTLAMGVANYLYAAGGRVTSVIMVNWFTDAVMALAMVAVILYKRNWLIVIESWRTHPKLLLTMSVADNIAWLSYTASALFIPVAISTSISETYIAVAALLGLVLNRERLRRHQLIAMITAITAAIMLGALRA